MDTLRFTILKFSTFLLLAYLISSISAASKYNTEENKPYEFGFNIEGEQHRREKKDENGIIMGEFGFITADGVYHVTVYATDENGNFKILSMKNIRLGAAPDKVPPNATPVNKILEPVTLPPPPPPPPRPPPVSNQKQPFTTPKPLPIASCSHCSIPSKRPPVSPNPFAPPPNQFNTPSTSLQGPLSNTNYNDLPQGDQPFNPQNTPNYNQPGSGQNFQNPGFPQSPAGQFSPNQQFGNPPNNKYTTPVVIAANLQKVPAEVANQPLLQGENPGLPNGVTSDNMMDLLYRFNYTIGFHGHYEQGYTNGAKVGEYYINYRNGYATKVSYVANENGYRPTITTVRLSPNETPNPETEKDEEFGLKGYEFKWFYVPKYHHLNRY